MQSFINIYYRRHYLHFLNTEKDVLRDDLYNNFNNLLDQHEEHVEQSC